MSILSTPPSLFLEHICQTGHQHDRLFLKASDLDTGDSCYYAVYHAAGINPAYFAMFC